MDIVDRCRCTANIFAVEGQPFAAEVLALAAKEIKRLREQQSYCPFTPEEAERIRAELREMVFYE